MDTFINRSETPFESIQSNEAPITQTPVKLNEASQHDTRSYLQFLCYDYDTKMSSYELNIEPQTNKLKQQNSNKKPTANIKKDRKYYYNK